MSNTSKTVFDPRKMVVYRTATFLTVVAGNKHRRFSTEELGEEMVTHIYNAALAFKSNPTPENEESLRKYLDPDYRLQLEGGISKDIHGNLYLDEMPHIPMERAIADLFKDYLERGIDTTPVLNFWKLSLDNPNEQSRKDLMSYVERFGIPVTDSGYMILYKAVQDKNEVIEKLAYFVGQEFFELKRQKKNPADYIVYERPEELEKVLPRFMLREKAENSPGKITVESEGQASTMYEVWWTESPDDEDGEPDYTVDSYDQALEELINMGGSIYDRHEAIREIKGASRSTETVLIEHGDLDTLFRNLVLKEQDLEPDEEDKQPAWRPYHSGPYGKDIRLGKVVTMPREECDSDISRDCSYGLHVGSYEYVRRFGTQKGTVLACLVNPRDIVALPQYDHSKIRCCAYLPYGIIKKDEQGNWEEAETTHWEEGFVDYEKAELEKRIKELQEELGSTDTSRTYRTEELLNLVKNRLQKIQA